MKLKYNVLTLEPAHGYSYDVIRLLPLFFPPCSSASTFSSTIIPYHYFFLPAHDKKRDFIIAYITNTFLACVRQRCFSLFRTHVSLTIFLTPT
jgi:hypothetical protein